MLRMDANVMSGRFDAQLAERGLPPLCYWLGGSDVPVFIRRGVSGCYPVTNAPEGASAAELGEWIARQNGRLGVSETQAEAMFAGSAFGWHVPLADPRRARR